MKNIANLYRLKTKLTSVEQTQPDEQLLVAGGNWEYTS